MSVIRPVPDPERVDIDQLNAAGAHQTVDPLVSVQEQHEGRPSAPVPVPEETGAA